MKTINIILIGFGNVGKAFARLVLIKKKDCAQRYGCSLELKAVFNSRGGLLLPAGKSAGEHCRFGDSTLDMEKSPYWQPGRILGEALEAYPVGVLVDCTPSNITTGKPALQFIHQAMDFGWHVVTANKGPLVVDFSGLRQKAQDQKVSLGMSGAAAAALPALDVALHSLAGTEILRIEGILNGTSNYVLTRMNEGESYDIALEEARQKGIAEPDPSLDVEGWDTSAKILIISNAVFRTGFTLGDVRTEGITNISAQLWKQVRNTSKALKLVGGYRQEGGVPQLETRLRVLQPPHPLYAVNGTQKGITFFTDTMNSVTVTGGKSDPNGAAAALLKDIINIYRSSGGILIGRQLDRLT